MTTAQNLESVRRTMRRLLLTFSVLAAPSLAAAQSAPAVPPPNNTTTVQGSVTLQAPVNSGAMAPVQVPQPAQCSPAADSLYNEAMNRMAAGDDASAATLFGRVVEMCPTHPTAAEMRRNAEQHAQARSVPVVNNTVPVVQPPVAQGWPTGGQGWTAPVPNYNLVYGPDPVSTGARLNLVIGQTLFGMALGAYVPPMVASGSVGGEHVAGGILLGGALGAAGSLVASLGGVTQGQAIAVNFGSGIGFGVGATVALMTGFSSTQLTFGMFAAGQAVGTAVGAVIALQRPLSGTMSYISSLAGWGTMLSSHVLLGVTNISGVGVQAVGATLLGGMAAGTLAGALSSSYVHISADRMGWIDLSMSVGWLVFGASSLLFASSSPSAGIAYGWGSIAGAGLGAVFGILMTRDTDRYWHQAREQQLQQQAAGGRQARHSATPASVHVAPGGPGNNPMGVTVAGTF